MERGILLETLANQLPDGAVRFSSKLAKIQKTENGETLLELVDGTQLSAKVTLNLLSDFLSIFLYADGSILLQSCYVHISWY